MIWQLLNYVVSSSGSWEVESGKSLEIDVNTQHLSPLDERATNAEELTCDRILPEGTGQGMDAFALDWFEMSDIHGFSTSDWDIGQL